MDKTLKITTPSDRELVMTHAFDDPRTLAFDALTRPELLRRWYGPVGWSLVVCEIDLRVGGAWRFDALIKSGMTSGAAEEYDKLADSLASAS